MTHVTVSKLDKSFGTNKILDQFSLHIQKGEFLSLLGPSGSGKTTVLRCIAGLETPDETSAEIVIDGIKVWTNEHCVPPEKRNLGMVFQNYAVWPHLNVFENTAFPLRVRRLSDQQIQSKVQEVLSMVRLGGLEKRFPHELSGGQQQRVALARALAMSPQVLLLDEPLSNLDALLREELGAEIRKLQKNLNLTTILVTHDRKEALSLSDRIVLLKDGRIEVEGVPEVLYNTPPTPFTALFLSGAQLMKIGDKDLAADAQDQLFLPRRWQVELVGLPQPKPVGQSQDQSPVDGQDNKFSVVARLYLGSEYEYWAENSQWVEPIRFFSTQRIEIGSPVQLKYMK